MTEQDFRNMLQTEIGALAAEGKGMSHRCGALRETLYWMNSTDFQYRKRNFIRKGEAEGKKAEEPMVCGEWIRPEGATPKSYTWECSLCGGRVHYAPSGKKGEQAQCDYPFCARCGKPMR